MQSLKSCFGSIAILIAVNFVVCGQEKDWHRKEVAFPALGVEIKIVAYVDSNQNFDDVVSTVKTELKRLNLVFSNYTADSEIEKLSLAAPQMKKVSSDLWDVIVLTNQVYEKSHGAFDPSVGAATAVWAKARKRNRLPDIDTIRQAMENVGWKNHIRFENGDVGLSSSKVKLDFGGIAKGYIADQIVKLIRNKEIKSILVDLGGDLAVGDAPPNSSGWKISIESSCDEKQHLILANCGVATSGDSKQRIVKDGIRYSHIIDPRNGNAVTHSYLVTVVADDCATADAYASALSVLHVDKGIKIAESVPNLEVRIEVPGPQPLTKKSKRFGDTRQ